MRNMRIHSLKELADRVIAGQLSEDEFFAEADRRQIGADPLIKLLTDKRQAKAEAEEREQSVLVKPQPSLSFRIGGIEV